MTMLIWAGCENFALMMADRRAFNSLVVAAPDGSAAAFGEMVLGEDRAKAVASTDMRDVFAAAGTNNANDMVTRAMALHGVVADVALFSAVQPSNPLEWALDPAFLGTPNVIFHSYRHDSKIVLTRLTWSPTILMRQIVIAPSDKVVVVVDGSGGNHVQGLVNADQKKFVEQVETQVADWRPVQAHLLGIFAAVAGVDQYVGPDVDTWLLTKDEGLWRKLAA